MMKSMRGSIVFGNMLCGLYGRCLAALWITLLGIAAITMPIRFAAAADLSGSYAWNPVSIGAGGWVTGFVTHPLDATVRYCRTDVGNSYRWDNTAGTWTPMIVRNSDGSGVPANVAAAPGGAGCEEIAVDPSNTSIVYISFPVGYSADSGLAALTNTVYKSTNGGRNFTPTGLSVTGGPNGTWRWNTERMKVDPNNGNVIYYGSLQNGLWRSANGGTTWTNVTTGGAPGATTNVLNIGFYKGGGTVSVGGQTVSSVIYLDEAPNGASEPASGDVYRSTDGGQTWTNISTGTALSGSPGKMTVDQNGNMWVTQLNTDNLWKCTNAGVLSSVNIAGLYSGVNNVTVDPNNASRMFASSEGGGLARSLDGGATWTALDNAYIFANTLGWLPQPIQGWRSNSGVYFDKNSVIWSPEGNEGILTFAPTANNTESPSNPPQWTIASQGIEEFCGQNVILPKGLSDKAFICVQDGTGLSITDPSTYSARWVNLQTGLLSNSGGNAWCPNASSYIAYNTYDTWGGSGNHSGYSSDGGNTWTPFAASPGNFGGYIAISRRGAWGLGSDHIVILPDNNGLPVYSKNGGASWAATSSFPLGDGGYWNFSLKNHQLMADPFTPDKFYLKVTDGPLCVTTDGGVTWTSLSTALPNTTHHGQLETNMNVQNDLWFCDGWEGATAHGVWHSTDGGATWALNSFFTHAIDLALGAGDGVNGDAPYTVYCYGVDSSNTYGVFRSTNSGTSWDRISYFPAGIFDTPAGMAASWDTYGLVYVMFSGNTAGYGKLTTATIPSAPGYLTATPGNAQAILSWNPSPGATSYNLKRSTVDGSGYATITSPTTTNYTNTGLTNGTTYYYVVTAVNSNGESPISTQVSATPAAPPAAPTGLTATAGDTQVVLSWNASSGATSYNLLRSTVSGSGYASVATGITVTNYTNTGLTDATTYYFVVSATNVGGTSPNSAQASATPQLTPPPTPTGLTAIADNTLVSLSWAAAPRATSYNVLRSTVSGSGYASIATGVAAASYVNTGLTNGTTYYYVVSAANAAGTSANSAQVAATPQVFLALFTEPFNYAAGSLPTVSSGKWTGPTTGDMWSAANTGVGTGSLQYTKNAHALSGTGLAAVATIGTVGEDIIDSYTLPSNITSANTSSGYIYVGVLLSFTGSPQYWSALNLQLWKGNGTGSGSTDLQAVMGMPNQADFNLDYATRGMNTGGQGAAWVETTSPISVSVSQASFMVARLDFVNNKIRFFINPDPGASTPVGNSDFDSGDIAVDPSNLPFQTLKIERQNTQGGNAWIDEIRVADRFTGLVNGSLGPPSIPTALSATAGNAQVALSWGLSASATSYNVLRSTVSGSGYASVATGIVPTNYTNTGLTNGTTYYFVVSATNAQGTSANSAQASATPQLPPPAAPTGLTATPATGKVTLSWTASSGATSYNVLSSTVSGSGYASIATGIAVTNYTNTGLTNGTTYYYVVTATNTAGTSANSAQASATPQVESPWSGTACGGSAWPAPGQIEAENYDCGGEAIAYHSLSSVNQGGKDRTDGVGIEVCSDTGGGYDVCFTAAGQWLNYMCSVASTGTYNISFRVASPSAGNSFHLNDTNGTNLTGSVTVPNTGGWETWTTVTVNNVTLSAGAHTFQIFEDTAGYNINWMSFTSTGAPPAAPTGLTATPGNTQVALSWTASTGATSYNAKRSTVNGSGYATVSSPTVTTYTDTGLTNGTTYYYVVSAVNANGESANSAQASATPQPAAPAAPTGLTATPGNTQVALSWSASSGATSYNVLRSTVNGSGYASVATGIATTSYTNTGLTNGTTYYFVVTATNAGGTSANSAQASATPISPPPAPTGLTATPGNAQVALSWSASTGATTYNVSRSTVSGTGYASVAAGITVTSYTNTGLTNGTTYYFVVSATNAGGTSANSAEAAATPQASAQILNEPFNYTPGALPTVSSGLWTGPVTGDIWAVANSGVGTGSLQYTKNAHSLTGTGLAAVANISTTGEFLTNSYTFPSTITSANSTTGYIYVGALMAFPGNAGYWSGLNVTLWKGNGTGSVWTDEQAFFGTPNGPDLTLNYATRAMDVGSNGMTWTSAGQLMSASVSQATFMVARIDFTNNLIRFFVNPDPGASTPIGNSDVDSGDIACDPSNLPFQTITIDRDNTTSGSAWIDEIHVADTYTGLVSGVPPPAAPTGLTATPGNAQAALSWTASTGATSYNALRSTVSGSGYASVATGIATTSYTNTGLTNGTTYYFVVQAVNSGGTSGNSNQASATPVAAPAAPTGLTTSAGNAQALVFWTASSGATSYNVLRSTVSGSGYASIASGLAATFYDDTGLTNGTVYYYVAQAANIGGTSANSAQASASPAVAPQAQIPFATTAPVIDGSVDSVWSSATAYSINNVINYAPGTITSNADLSGTWQSLWDSTNLYVLVTVTDDVLLQYVTNPWDSDSIEVYIDGDHNGGTVYDANDFQYAFPWNSTTIVETKHSPASLTGVVFAQTNITGGYRIELKIPWSTITVTPAANNLVGIDVHINDADTARGTRDSKRMWNDTTDLAWNNPSLFGAGKLLSGPPAAPTGLTATPGNAQVVLSWTASTGATSYNVKRSTVSGSGYATVSSPTVTNYTNTGLTNGTTYYFVVTAVSTGGESGNSSQASAKPVAPPAAPTGLTAATGTTTGTVNLAWTASSGATSYNVYRGTAAGGESTTPVATGVATTSYTSTGMTSGTTYYFKVKAVNAGGTSGYSSEKSAKAK